MPLILGLVALLGTGGLFFKTAADEIDETITNTTPQLVTLGALAIAGFAVWALARRKR